MSHFFYNPGSQASMNPHNPYQQSHGHGNNNNNSNNNHHQHHHHHGGRSRRGPRFNSSNGNQKQFKPVRNNRESTEIAQAATWRRDFEAAKAFDLEDDEVFCPWHLLTDEDLVSIQSSSSERSSSSGGSPDASPPQQQLQPTPSFNLSAAVPAHVPQASMQHSNSSHLKLHQPMAQRARNPIPIVDPNSRNTSPPNSISPNKQVQKPYGNARRW
ncbi:MAG: hypothetical protein M1831_003581 [Alyxoria varia]|nr:MAG: hypothetical protein M1831_003581 [Alyxoria varia]